MAKQFSTVVRNGILEAIELSMNGQTLNAGVVSGTAAAPVLRIYTGAPPADCATAASGTLLVSMTLPADWLANAGTGAKTILGTWQANASAAGTAGYYRIWNGAVSTCHEQGTVTLTGSGGDMTLDNTNIANTQQVTVTSYTLNAGNA